MHVSAGLIAIIMFSQSRKKYGADNKADVPGGTINYIYQPNTGNTNLWKHLYKVHAAKYDQKVKDNHNWNYPLSTQVKNQALHKNASNVCDPSLPPFTQEVFVERIVNLIVANDLVSLES